MGAGELAATILGGILCRSPSAALLLCSLLSWLPSLLFSLLLLSADPVESGLTLSGRDLGGAVQRGTSHKTPVKLFNLKPPLAHLRQGLPDRSRARRPALIAPWFALGPSLWYAPPARELGSIEPSSLLQ